jgi:hypothetical protein
VSLTPAPNITTNDYMREKTKTKTLPVSFRLEPELKEALMRLVDRDNRSLSNYVENLLRAHVNKSDKAK